MWKLFWDEESKYLFTNFVKYWHKIFYFDNAFSFFFGKFFKFYSGGRIVITRDILKVSKTLLRVAPCTAVKWLRRVVFDSMSLAHVYLWCVTFSSMRFCPSKYGQSVSLSSASHSRCADGSYHVRFMPHHTAPSFSSCKSAVAGH